MIPAGGAVTRSPAVRLALIAGLAACAALGLLAAGLSGGCARDFEEARPQTLRLRIPSDPSGLDPALAVDEPATVVIAQLFDGLVALDPATGEPRPSLASAWEIGDGGARYIFSLAGDARFHSGRRVEADDVVFSFERLLAPATGSPHAWILAEVLGADAYRKGSTPRLQGVRALDPERVEVRLRRPFGPFLSLLAQEPASILPREIYGRSGGAFARHPVGAGPYELGRWNEGRQIVLRASGFPRAGSSAPGRIAFRIIPSASEAVGKYLEGSLDVLDEVPSARRGELLGRMGAELRRHTRLAVAFLAFDHAGPPFGDNLHLRRAFNHAIDRKALCGLDEEGGLIPASAILPPGVAGHDPAAPGYPYDPELARRLLARAGYAGGKGLPEIVLGCTRSRSHRRLCRKIREDLAAIGVKISLREVGPGDLARSLHSARAEGAPAMMIRMAWMADVPDPDAFLRPTLHSESPPAAGNYGRYSNARFDRALDAALAEPDPPRRARLYGAAERIAVEDAAWVLLYHYGDEALVKPHVANMVFPTFGELQGPLHEVRLDAGTRVARF